MEEINKLRRCYKCKRETSMLFCIDCIGEEVNREKGKLKKKVFDALNQLRGEVYDDGCGDDDWHTFDKEKDGGYIKFEELKKQLEGVFNGTNNKR